MPQRTLTQTYIHRGRHYGPGVNVEIPEGLDNFLAGQEEDAADSTTAITNFPATQVVSGTVAVSNFPADAGLTNAQLRATPILVMDPIAYYASAAGGRVAYNITTGVVTIGSSGEQSLAALVNPSDSGKDLVLDLGEFGASAVTTFRRYRNATITPTGAPLTGSNIGGGSTTTVARMYVGGTSPTFTRSGGTVSKDAFIAASTTYFTFLRGRSIIRPGQSVSWTIQGPNSGNFTASVYFEFYEVAAAS